MMRVNNNNPHFRSDVYISGVRKDKNTGAFYIVSATELKNIVNTERYKRPTDFNNLFITEVEVLLFYILIDA